MSAGSRESLRLEQSDEQIGEEDERDDGANPVQGVHGIRSHLLAQAREAERQQEKSDGDPEHDGVHASSLRTRPSGWSQESRDAR
jgi:hypothetical protein